MAGGIIAALIISDNDPGFIHNGALAGLVSICAGSDQVHPIGALATGAVRKKLEKPASRTRARWRRGSGDGVDAIHNALVVSCGPIGVDPG